MSESKELLHAKIRALRAEKALLELELKSIKCETIEYSIRTPYEKINVVELDSGKHYKFIKHKECTDLGNAKGVVLITKEDKERLLHLLSKID